MLKSLDPYLHRKVARAHLASSRGSTQSKKSALAGVLMCSAEIAKTTDEMEADMDAVMDAGNGDVMEAETTAEMTNEKDAEILETKTRVPPMSGDFPPHHLDSPRVRVTRTKSAGSYHARTCRGPSADHVNGDRPRIPAQGEAQG